MQRRTERAEERAERRGREGGSVTTGTGAAAADIDAKPVVWTGREGGREGGMRRRLRGEREKSQ